MLNDTNISIKSIIKNISTKNVRNTLRMVLKIMSTDKEVCLLEMDSSSFYHLLPEERMKILFEVLKKTNLREII